ncbi:hypothetical protein ILYODFUR_007969 [Ilyodon furcidens]|uniref:Uncharacterized protein n=1 Tax=Ilyodon furcidens TaxID=33524 RepID=A0ABV0SJE5_9TELE
MCCSGLARLSHRKKTPGVAVGLLSLVDQISCNNLNVCVLKLTFGVNVVAHGCPSPSMLGLVVRFCLTSAPWDGLPATFSSIKEYTGAFFAASYFVVCKSVII